MIRKATTGNRMHAVRMSLKYTFKVFLPLHYYCPAPGRSSPGFAGPRARSVFLALRAVRFVAVASDAAYRGCARLALRNRARAERCVLVSSSVAALSSRAFPLHMQKPLADAPARVGGDGAAVGTHDPMVGDDHGEWVFSHRGPNSAV